MIPLVANTVNSDRHNVSPAMKIERTPFYLQSQGQPLFAWLHHCEARSSVGHGVILCPPVGYEQIHSHRSLRHLADALAQAGFGVLRFDYHGTGDSAGIDEDADRHSTWLANIRDAKAWLEQEMGYARISLFGLRLGASLAMQVVCEEPVENLVLWSPVVNGHRYVREMKALSLTAETEPQPLPEAPDDIEAAGFVMTKQTADALSGINLLQCRPLCQNALLIARNDLAEDRSLLEHLSAQGVRAEQAMQAGYAEMMAEPHYTKVPKQAIAHLVNWLVGTKSPVNHTGYDETRLKETSHEILITHQQYSDVPVSIPQRIRERVVWIGDARNLFGIFSEPEGPSRDDTPLILLVNAGSVHHVGLNRLYVLVARQLAAQGFRTLRMDLGGLGDSFAANPMRANDPFAASAFGDIEATLEQLQEHLGVKRVVLMGLCSGAYMAFHGAAQLANPILVESVLINPLTFYWREGMTLEAAPEAGLKIFHYYMRAALKPSKWLKFLSGTAKTGLCGAIRILANRWRLRKDPTNQRPACGGDGKLGHPVMEDLPADFERIVTAGRRVTCFFAKSDPGYSIMMFHARRKVNELCRTGKLKLFFIEDADHTFSRRVPRRTVVQKIADHLRQRYLPDH
jgi:pimeloyl-ACP methyl ester carboxylesterase